MNNGSKILLIATTSSMIGNFNIDNIKILQSLGAKVFVGTNFNAPGSITVKKSTELKKRLHMMGVKCYQIDFERRTGSIKNNIRIVKQIRNIILREKITGLHVQSPLGGVLGRIAAHGLNATVLYTAHGFQFFHGGLKKDWVLFYPVERVLAHWCDALITINTDDFNLAQKFKTRVFYITGVGTKVNEVISLPERSKQRLRENTRKKLGIAADDFLIISVGELTKRKNHQLMIKALSKINNPKIKYIIAGVGQEKMSLENLITDLNLKKQVKLIGLLNKEELNALYYAADLNIFISRREGLGYGGLDGISHGLYIIGNGNTGMKDYIINRKIGRLVYDPDDVDGLVKIVKEIVKNRPQIPSSEIKYMEKFDQSNINQKMRQIYKRVFDL